MKCYWSAGRHQQALVDAGCAPATWPRWTTRACVYIVGRGRRHIISVAKRLPPEVEDVIPRPTGIERVGGDRAADERWARRPRCRRAPGRATDHADE